MQEGIDKKIYYIKMIYYFLKMDVVSSSIFFSCQKELLKCTTFSFRLFWPSGIIYFTPFYFIRWNAILFINLQLILLDRYWIYNWISSVKEIFHVFGNFILNIFVSICKIKIYIYQRKTYQFHCYRKNYLKLEIINYYIYLLRNKCIKPLQNCIGIQGASIKD